MKLGLWECIACKSSGHPCLTDISLLHDIRGQDCPFCFPLFQQPESNESLYSRNILYFKSILKHTNELFDYHNQKH